MMRAARRVFRRFWRDQSGAVVIDYIPVFFVMILIILLIFEIGIAYFVSLRSQKAAQLGARIAAVTPAIHSGVPTRNERPGTFLPGEPTGADGEPCFNPSGPDRCVDPGGPWVCDGANLDAACDGVAFGRIVRDMRRTFGNLDPASVRITYIYRVLGETGGPFIPEVNVTISAQEFGFVVFTLGDYCRRNGENCSPGGSDLERNSPRRYGSVSASAYGENTAGLVRPTPLEIPPVETGS